MSVSVTRYGRLCETVEGDWITLSVGDGIRCDAGCDSAGRRLIVVVSLEAASSLLQILLSSGSTRSILAADIDVLARRLGLREQTVEDLGLLGLIQSRDYLDGVVRREYSVTTQGRNVLRQLVR